MKKETENKYKAFIKNLPIEDDVKIKDMLSSIERTYLPLGSQIGKYRIIEEIDRGGMAVVYKVCQLDLDRIVALKVLPANITINRNFVERFLSEAHAVAKLQHPNIVNIHEVSMEKSIYFLAMDYIPGKNLYYYLNQEKPKLVDVLEITRKLTEALEYAHNMKILHRDLKLNNVIMKDNTTPVLIDFGLAKAIGGEDPDLTKTGEIAGSPAYMAPERVFGKGVDTRSDICSLGIMLYEMLTFKNPYLDPRSIVQTAKNVVEANPVTPRNLVPWLPLEVESIALKAMSCAPEDRYQTMKEFGEDIQRYQHGEPVIARPPSLWSMMRRFFRKHWAPIIITSIILLFTGLIMLIMNIQTGKEKSRWQLTFNETFDNAASLKNWFVYSGKISYSQPTGAWGILDSSLYVESSDYSFLRLKRPFTKDLRVEFDIKAGLKDLFNAGFFICGSVPDSGYCFRIHRKGAALNGITYPGSKFLFYDYKPIEFSADSQYHVVVEKKDHIITFRLNDVMISKVYDFFPTLGKNHQKLGFFVSGSSIAFDNLRVYRRAVPRLARPTIIADRFWEQGDFEIALAEYRDVLLDLSRSDIARQIKFKMVDCLIRLQEFEEAENILNEIELAKNLNDSEKARILFLQGMLNYGRGDSSEMNYALLSLAELFPYIHINQSAAADMVVDCYNLFISGERDSAESRIVFLTKKYPEFSHHFGRIHLEILDYYTTHGFWNKAQKIGRRIVSLYNKDEEILFEAKILLAKIHLGKREKYKAVDVLNQCLASSQASIAKWHAWMTLAEVYEYEHNYNDAFTIYKKISADCPKNIPISWMAYIRMAEMAVQQVQSKQSVELIFKHVIDGPHVFTEPRLIAQFYLNLFESEYFKRQWQLLNPDNLFYLYYLSRKAMMQGDYSSAEHYLRKLMNSTSPNSWEYVRVFNVIEDLKVIKKLNKKE